MSEKYLVRDLMRATCRATFVSACIASASLSLYLPVPSCDASEFSANAAISRRYSLAGSLELSYDRYWSQGQAATNNFRQNLLLNHGGFVVDPNLVSYSLSGTVTHASDSSTLTGADLGITLLHALPGSWKQNEDYIPHPVWLRYSHEADSSFEFTSYGLSFVHSVELKQRYLVTEKAIKAEGEDADLYEDASMTSKIVEKERAVPIPRTFFDYDHNEMKNERFSTLKDNLSLRSFLKGTFYDYRFLFEHENETTSVALTKNVVQLEPNYEFYNEETLRRITIRNVLRYEELNQAKILGLTSSSTLQFYDKETRRRIALTNVLGHEEVNRTQINQLTSSLSLFRPIGKDDFSLTGVLGYAGVSAPGQTAANYIAVASGAYTHRHQLSSSLTNSSSLTASISESIAKNDTKIDSAVSHVVGVSDAVSGDISQLFRGTASATVGESAQGTQYGANVSLFTKTRITTSLGYSYSLSAPQVLVSTNLAQQGLSAPQAPVITSPALQGSSELQQQQGSTELQQVSSGRTSQHNVTFGASGPLLDNLSFQARGISTLSEVPVVGGTSRQMTGTLSGNLLWRLPKTSVTLGGNYTQMKKVDPEMSALSSASSASSTSSTSLYSTLSRVLPNRMDFNLYNTWTKTDSTGTRSSESTRVEIRPSLRWTRGLTSVNTEYSYSKSTGVEAVNSFFIRMVRRFSAN